MSDKSIPEVIKFIEHHHIHPMPWIAGTYWDEYLRLQSYPRLREEYLEADLSECDETWLLIGLGQILVLPVVAMDSGLGNSSKSGPRFVRVIDFFNPAGKPGAKGAYTRPVEAILDLSKMRVEYSSRYYPRSAADRALANQGSAAPAPYKLLSTRDEVEKELKLLQTEIGKDVRNLGKKPYPLIAPNCCCWSQSDKFPAKWTVPAKTVSNKGPTPTSGSEDQMESWLSQNKELADNSLKEAKTRLVNVREGQTDFSRKIRKAYGEACAISGVGARDALEAAHIIPYDGPETNLVQNGILLRRDLHALFDAGLLSITKEYTVAASSSLTDPLYREYHGRPLRLPRDQQDWPSKAALAVRNALQVIH